MIKLALANDHQSITDGIKLLVEYRNNIEFTGVANDGVELLKLVEQKRTNIVIIDLRKPKLDGIEATKAIKKKNIRESKS